MEYTRYYRLLTVEKKDLELDLKALGIPGMFRGAVSAVRRSTCSLMPITVVLGLHWVRGDA